MTQKESKPLSWHWKIQDWSLKQQLEGHIHFQEQRRKAVPEMSREFLDSDNKVDTALSQGDWNKIRIRASH